VGDLDKLAVLGATATYNGSAWGTVDSNLGEGGWKTYDASGDLTMNWSFAHRKGDLTISNFDSRHVNGGLTFGSGPYGMTQIPNLNQFAGSLSGSGLSGSATGSFVNNGSVAAGGVIGNWNVGDSNYKATGIFGGAGTPVLPGH
jgi:hypothetical protein